MKTNREEFIQALEQVLSGVARKEILEQSNCFVFTENRIFSYNDEIAVSCQYEGIDFEGAIPAKPFYDFLKRINQDEITIEIKKGELYVLGKKLKAGIRLQKDIVLPIDEIEIPEKWLKLSPDFKEGCRMVLPSTGTDATKPSLMCVHVFDNIIEATNRFKATRYFMENNSKKPFLLPRNPAMELLKNDDIEKYNVNNGWIHFQNKDKNLIFSCRTYDVEYKDIDFIFDFEEETQFEIPQDKVIPILEEVDVFIEGEIEIDRRAIITLFENSLKIRGQGEVGWAEEVIKCKNNIEDEIVFEVNGKTLIEILKKENKITYGERRLKFEGEKFQHVLTIHIPKGE